MAIEFYLNDEKITLNLDRANITLLEYLRETKRLKGTKEGCAEGDCGACTVLLGRLRNGELEYRSMNACIAFLPMLHGGHLVTIEALSAGGELHWVQDAMIEHHGAQCGFCTPGIVMSLYAAWMNKSPQSYEDWQKALQGNLCRCTGYASILRAMTTANANLADDPLVKHRANMSKKLAELNQDGEVEGAFIPNSLEALETMAKAHPDAIFIAGATDVGLWVTKQFRTITPSIYLQMVDDLSKIEIADDEVRLGAMVSYDEAENRLSDVFPDLKGLWPRIAGAQVRNMGTIGGNIANGSPIGDMPPVLIAMNARILLNQGGQRRELALEDFFIDYGKQDRQAGEFLEAIIIPRKNQMRFIEKISKRRDEDISSVLGAIALVVDGDQITDARIAFGGMASTPKRATSAENMLIGQPIDETSFRQAMNAIESDFTPISDMRASAEYRMKTAKNILLKAFFHFSNLH